MKKFLGLLALVFLFGCATSSHIITGKIRPAISPDGVKIYSSMPAGAEEIAILSGNANNLKTDSTIAALKKDAAKLGANGVVVEKASAGAWVGASVSGKAIFVP